MIDSIRLSNLPGYAKLFVALFTSLMLCVDLASDGAAMKGKE